MSSGSQRLLVSAIPASFAGAAVGAPYLAAAGYSAITLAILVFFSPVCHQDPARSFWFLGAPVAVCARCLGIYLGAAVGAWVPASRRVLLWALGFAAAANLADWATEAAGLHGNWMDARFGLGFLLGGVCSALIVESLTSGAKAPFKRSALRHG